LLKTYLFFEFVKQSSLILYLDDSEDIPTAHVPAKKVLK